MAAMMIIPKRTSSAEMLWLITAAMRKAKSKPRVTRTDVRQTAIKLKIKSLRPSRPSKRIDIDFMIVNYTPLAETATDVLRRERDSNSRSQLRDDSLVNCWFKPLTHLSGLVDTTILLRQEQIY